MSDERNPYEPAQTAIVDEQPETEQPNTNRRNREFVIGIVLLVVGVTCLIFVGILSFAFSGPSDNTGNMGAGGAVILGLLAMVIGPLATISGAWLVVYPSSAFDHPKPPPKAPKYSDATTFLFIVIAVVTGIILLAIVGAIIRPAIVTF